jgi:hypothetical protein
MAQSLRVVQEVSGQKKWGSRLIQAHLKKCDEEVCREEVQPEASDHTY